MATVRSRIFQSLKSSKEDKFVKATLFPRHSKYENDFMADDSVCVKQVEKTMSRDTVPCMDALGSEGFSKSSSLQSLFDEEDSDGEVEKAMNEDYFFGDSDESEIMSCMGNKNVDDEIDQPTGEFRSRVMKAAYGETRVLHDSTPSTEKGLEIKITMDVVQRSSNSSNSYSERSAHQRSKSVISESPNFPFQSRKSDGSKENATPHHRSKSVISESTNFPFQSRKAEVSKENETPQNDPGRPDLPLPPRLREVSHRNPLSLTLPRKNSIRSQPASSVEQLFEPNEPSPRHNVQSKLSKIVKKPKDLSVKLWKNNLDLLRKPRKNPEPQLPSHASSRQPSHDRPDCRLNWIQSLQLKLKIKSADVLQAQATLSASRRTLIKG